MDDSSDDLPMVSYYFNGTSSPVKIIRQFRGHRLFIVFQILQNAAFFKQNNPVADIGDMSKIVT